MELRIGTGYDIHKLVPKRPLILGGIKIEHPTGLAGHSDADVVIHALSDAILGALSMPDIGTYFPDNQKDTHNLNSKHILLFARSKMYEYGFKISNVDLVIITEEPKLFPFYGKIKNSLANILQISPNQIGIKAKTNEKMGIIGAKQAIAVIANVLLQKS